VVAPQRAPGSSRRQSIDTPDGVAQNVPLATEELNWLRLLAKDRTVGEVADLVFRSKRDLERRLRALYRRLGVGGRSGAMVWAAVHGYLVPDPLVAADDLGDNQDSLDGADEDAAESAWRRSAKAPQSLAPKRRDER
jgi:DNA-binding CsgD family transcriptional regulator